MVSFVDQAPTVEVVAYTQPNIEAMKRMVSSLGVEWKRGEEMIPEAVAVFAGAGCYLSYDNKAGKTDAEYLRSSIIDQRHHSVLEHINISFGVTNLPRSVQMEVIRHRAGSAYSFVSQRFVNTEGTFIVPPIIRSSDSLPAFKNACTLLYENYTNLLQGIREDYQDEDVTGTLKRKRQKEAARALLPNAIASSGVITYNARQLRHVIQMRSDQHADASIREFAEQLYLAASEVIPYVFQDASVTVIEGVREIRFSGGT